MEVRAFLSYAQVDEVYSKGGISQLHKLIETEVRSVTEDNTFKIIRDVEDIEVGNNIDSWITERLNEAIILIAIITPSYFESEYCLKELELFLHRENELGRNDLIIPIYFLESKNIEGPDYSETRSPKIKRAARVLKQRQYLDIREFYVSGLLDQYGHPLPEVQTMVSRISNSIRIILDTQKTITAKVRSDLANKQFTRISVTLPTSIDEFTPDQLDELLLAISSSLDISQDDIYLHDLQSGSVKISIELPSEDANALLTNWNYQYAGHPIIVEKQPRKISGERLGQQEKITILCLAAEPSDTARLRLGEEHRQVFEAVNRAKCGSRFEIQQIWAVSARDILRFI